MFANSLRAAATQMGTGYVLTKDEVQRRIDDFNAARSGTGKAFIGRECQEAIFTLTFNIPAAALEVLYTETDR